MISESISSINNSRNIETRKRKNLLTVEQIEKKVKLALTHFGERNPDDIFKNTPNSTRLEMDIIRRASEFRGQLSTKPEMVNKKSDKKAVNQANLTDYCEFFSRELLRCVKQEGLKTMMVSNQEADHLFLVTPGKEGSVIIDPTLV